MRLISDNLLRINDLQRISLGCDYERIFWLTALGPL